MAAQFLYRFYRADGVLLYVGVTVDIAKRFTSHRRWSAWYDKAASYTVAEFETRGQVLHAEVLAIRNEGPLYNRAGNVGWTVEAASLGQCLSPQEGARLERQREMGFAAPTDTW